MTLNTRLLTPLVLGSIMSLFSVNAHANLLTNGGFEMPDTSTAVFCDSGNFTVAGWDCVNDSLIVASGAFFGTPVSHDAGGSQTLKLFGFDAGVFQAVSVTAGTTYEASVWAMNFAADSFNHVALLALGFYDAGDNLLADTLLLAGQFDGGDSFLQLAPQDGLQVSDWTRMSVRGQAPPGSATAQMLLLHIFDANDINPASAIYFDDASLSAIPVPAAVWLFGSGLIGLMGLARKNSSAS